MSWNSRAASVYDGAPQDAASACDSAATKAVEPAGLIGPKGVRMSNDDAVDRLEQRASRSLYGLGPVGRDRADAAARVRECDVPRARSAVRAGRGIPRASAGSSLARRDRLRACMARGADRRKRRQHPQASPPDQWRSHRRCRRCRHDAPCGGFQIPPRQRARPEHRPARLVSRTRRSDRASCIRTAGAGNRRAASSARPGISTPPWARTPLWGDWRNAPGLTSEGRQVLEETAALLRERLAALWRGGGEFRPHPCRSAPGQSAGGWREADGDRLRRLRLRLVSLRLRRLDQLPGARARRARIARRLDRRLFAR